MKLVAILMFCCHTVVDVVSDSVADINYASVKAGALILESSAGAKGYDNLLNSDKDKYGITECANKEKWVVIGLSEYVLIRSVVIASYEKYSSLVKDFQILSSMNHPVTEWHDYGTYTARPVLGSQIFNLTTPGWGRYLKLKFLSEYGDEHYCTISQISVHGSAAMETLQQDIDLNDLEVQVMENVMTQLGGGEEKDEESEENSDRNVVESNSDVDKADATESAAVTDIQQHVEEEVLHPNVGRDVESSSANESDSISAHLIERRPEEAPLASAADENIPRPYNSDSEENSDDEPDSNESDVEAAASETDINGSENPIQTDFTRTEVSVLQDVEQADISSILDRGLIVDGALRLLFNLAGTAESVPLDEEVDVSEDYTNGRSSDIALPTEASLLHAAGEYTEIFILTDVETEEVDAEETSTAGTAPDYIQSDNVIAPKIKNGTNLATVLSNITNSIVDEHFSDEGEMDLAGSKSVEENLDKSQQEKAHGNISECEVSSSGGDSTSSEDEKPSNIFNENGPSIPGNFSRKDLNLGASDQLEDNNDDIDAIVIDKYDNDSPGDDYSRADSESCASSCAIDSVSLPFLDSFGDHSTVDIVKSDVISDVSAKGRPSFGSNSQTVYSGKDSIIPSDSVDNGQHDVFVANHEQIGVQILTAHTDVNNEADKLDNASLSRHEEIRHISAGNASNGTIPLISPADQTGVDSTAHAITSLNNEFVTESKVVALNSSLLELNTSRKSTNLFNSSASGEITIESVSHNSSFEPTLNSTGSYNDSESHRSPQTGVATSQSSYASQAHKMKGINISCLENLRFHDFREKMMAKLQDSADVGNSSGVGSSPPNSQDSVFKPLILKIKKLEMKNLISEMYTNQIGDCYRSIFVDILSSWGPNGSMTNAAVEAITTLNEAIDSIEHRTAEASSVLNETIVFVTEQQLVLKQQSVGLFDPAAKNILSVQNGSVLINDKILLSSRALNSTGAGHSFISSWPRVSHLTTYLSFLYQGTMMLQDTAYVGDNSLLVAVLFISCLVSATSILLSIFLCVYIYVFRVRTHAAI